MAWIHKLFGGAAPRLKTNTNTISHKATAYHAGRIGKSTAKNTSGHYGIIWDKSQNKWQVRVNKKMCGRFATLEAAIACRDRHLVAVECRLQQATSSRRLAIQEGTGGQFYHAQPTDLIESEHLRSTGLPVGQWR